MMRCFNAVVLVLSMGLLAACASNNAVKLSPDTLAAFDAAKPFRVLWSVNAGAGQGSLAVKLQPALSKNQVYVADHRGGVRAFQRSNGQLQWQAKLKHTISAGVHYSQGGLLIVGNTEGLVFALDAQSGEQRWQAALSDAVLATPDSRGDKVFVKTVDGGLWALSSKDGKTLWHYQAKLPNLVLRGAGAPRASSRGVLSGFANGQMLAINSQTGVPQWQAVVAYPHGGSDLSRMVDVITDPVLAEGVVYVAAYQGDVLAVHVATGKVLWRHKRSAFAGLSLGDLLVVTGADDTLWAYQPGTGTVAWHQDGLKSLQLSGPAVLAGKVLVGDSRGYMYGLSENDGKLVARQRLASKGYVAAPVVDAQVAYALSQDGVLTAFTF